MAIVATGKKEYKLIPEGIYQGVCVDVIDLGEIYNEKFKKNEHKINVVFQLDEVNEETGKRFLAMQRFTLSLGEKSHLKPFLESWRGKKMTKEELEGFDVEKLIGANCTAQILHNEGWANIQSIMPVQKSAVKMVNEGYARQTPEQKPKDEELQYTGSPDITPADGEEDLPF